MVCRFPPMLSYDAGRKVQLLVEAGFTRDQVLKMLKATTPTVLRTTPHVLASTPTGLGTTPKGPGSTPTVLGTTLKGQGLHLLC